MPSQVLILHLSDLQFGDHSRFRDVAPEALGKALADAVRGARERLEIEAGVDLVVLSGDIAERAVPREYEHAGKFLDGLNGGLGLARDRYVFAPGNHDVSWAQCKRAEIDQETEGFDDAELARRLSRTKLQYFDGFVETFYGTARPKMAPLDRGASAIEYDDLPLSIGVLNSAERETHRDGEHGGFLSAEQAQALLNYWRPREEPRVRLVVVHHNPAQAPPAVVQEWLDHVRGLGSVSPETIAQLTSDVTGLGGRDELAQVLGQCRVPLFLHGHLHVTGHSLVPWPQSGGETTALGAGSLCVERDRLPQDQLNAAQLVLLDLKCGEVRWYVLSYDPRAVLDGHVSAGAFISDATQPKEGYRRRIPLPDGVVKKRAPRPSRGARDHSDFIAEYRRRHSHDYDRWDLRPVGAAQSGGAGYPIDPTLDAMYQPLRFAEGHDIEKLDEGETIEPEGLLRRGKPLIIRGQAGSGKTTWARWSFGRLLRSDGALPVMVELRRLARLWRERSSDPERRSLDAHLEGCVAEDVGSGWGGHLLGILKAPPPGLTPVMFVDGWDELGDLGEELRRKLFGFMESCPRVAVVATSRPYGEGRPSHSDGFEVLDIQPLNDAEIAAFAGRFFRECYGREERPIEESTREFLGALDRSDEAKDLARTALLLTMMLIISRSSPLPDKRHVLYDLCIRNLLSALPDRREAEGVALLREQWRPDDGEERLRATAQLAAGLQTEWYRSRERRQLAVTWDGMASHLPEDWPAARRQEFLAWLAGPSGVLVDRADGTLQFAHLSFQEYLAAWHLNATTEGESRVTRFREAASDASWWETLRLWAALIESRNPEWLSPVLAALANHAGDGLWLAGAVFADGLGAEALFADWCGGLSASLLRPFFDHRELCAQAWRSTRHGLRRTALRAALHRAAHGAEWLAWARFQAFACDANMGDRFAPPQEGAVTASVAWLLVSDEDPDTPRRVAASRVLMGSSPMFPVDDSGLWLLRAWPGHRCPAGCELQCMASLGVLAAMEPAVRLCLEPFEADDLARDRARDWARGLSRSLAQGSVGFRARDQAGVWARDLARDMARHWARDLDRGWVGDAADYYIGGLARFWAGHLARHWAADWARDLARWWIRYWPGYWHVYWAVDWAADFAEARGLAPERECVLDWALVEVVSAGRIGPRAVLATADFEASTPSAEVSLFAPACRLSLHPEEDDAELRAALERSAADVHPLWPALARHIARRSSDEDRALLEGLAREPGQCEPPLSWGLKYYVRGDVLLEDGSEVTLDDLCDRFDMPHLPYLEDMPPELEVDWDAEDD